MTTRQFVGKYLIGTLTLLMLSGSANAGPWSKSLGEFYLKVSSGFFLSNSFVDSSGAMRSGSRYLGYTTSVYAEIGLWNGLHVVVYLPHVLARNSFDDGSKFLRARGGDAKIGLQWTLPWLTAVKLAFKGEVKIPLYKVNATTGALALNFPAPGDGQIDVSLSTSIGGSIPNLPIYLFAEIGYQFRTETFVGPADSREFYDSIPFAFQAGWAFYKGMTLTFNVSGVLATRSGAVTKSYVAVGPALYLPVYKGLAVEVGYDPIVWARNSSKGQAFSFGLSYNFSK